MVAYHAQASAVAHKTVLQASEEAGRVLDGPIVRQVLGILRTALARLQRAHERLAVERAVTVAKELEDYIHLLPQIHTALASLTHCCYESFVRMQARTAGACLFIRDESAYFSQQPGIARVSANNCLQRPARTAHCRPAPCTRCLRKHCEQVRSDVGRASPYVTETLLASYARRPMHLYMMHPGTPMRTHGERRQS